METVGQHGSREVGESSELGVDGHAVEVAEGMYAAVVFDPDPREACATRLGAFSVDFPGEARAVV